ncbi:hypothetical protein [Ensifer aridi]|uniref:hypothetical protein n=1 Tax=Ensifer aridi TaxID=1708715 RepID=UPI000478F7D3|nr:hypothetical protein [Ensifer aridi]
MPTYTKSSSPAPDGMRLNLLDPGEAPDLTAVIAGLNRLYEMTMRGSQYTSDTLPIHVQVRVLLLERWGVP